MNPYCRVRKAPRSTGFTLIELMITVAVVGILAAVAYPSYTEHVRRSHRATAQGLLSDLATRQHQFFVDTRGYAADVTALRTSVPADVAARYDVTVSLVGGPPPGFTLTAAPKGSQASDKCGTMTIDAAGAKSPAECW